MDQTYKVNEILFAYPLTMNICCCVHPHILPYRTLKSIVFWLFNRLFIIISVRVVLISRFQNYYTFCINLPVDPKQNSEKQHCDVELFQGKKFVRGMKIQKWKHWKGWVFIGIKTFLFLFSSIIEIVTFMFYWF